MGVIKNESIIAVIPARGGSRRIPRKNLQPYMGKSLIAWAVESARKSRYLDDFCVSSEDDEIIKHATNCGAKVIKRPAWLATDRAMNEGVLIHLLYTWKWADWIVLLQPTSPQRTGADIDECIERAQMGSGCVTYNEHGKRNGAVYVTRAEHLISRAEFHREIIDQFFIMPNNRSLDVDYTVDLAHQPAG